MITIKTKNIDNVKDRIDRKRIDDDNSVRYFKRDMRCEDVRF